MMSVSVLVVLGDFAVETHGMPMKCRTRQANRLCLPFFLDSSWAVFASCCIQVGTREAKHVISSLQPDHESQSKWKGSSGCGGGLGDIFPSSVWWCVVPKVEIPRLPSSFQAVFGGSVASTKLPSLEIAPPTKASVEEAPAAHESGSFDAVFPSKQPQAVSHVTVSDRQSFPAVFKPSQPPSTTKKPSSTPSESIFGFLAQGVDGLQRQRPLAWQYQAGNSENGFLPRVRVKTWGDAQMHWHGVNDDPDGEDILPYIKEPDRPAKLPHVDWATPKRVKDVQFLANKKRRRTDAEEPLKNEEISSSSESSDDEPLVPLQNQPHSAARVRVRRTFARVFACSDEEREAQGLREEGCRSDLSESSSEGWQPPNALGIRLTNTFCSGMIDWN
eukprot:g14438.t1